MTVIHQEQSISRPHPLDLLERTVEENGWAFERASADELTFTMTREATTGQP